MSGRTSMTCLASIWRFYRTTTIPTVSPAKNSLVYFISIAYIDHPVWRSHREEAKRGPPCGHRITRNEGAMVPFRLPCATTGWSSIAAWCGSGATSSGSTGATCLNAAARTLRAARAVQGDVVSVWQVLHGTPSAPPIPAQRVARFDGHCTRNCLLKNKLRQRYSRFTDLELNVEEPWCQTCGGRLTVCDHRHRRLFTLHGPVHVVCKLVHCPHQVCPAHTRTISPAAETALALPWWVLGCDVVCWLGQRRFARHWSVAQLRAELADTYQSRLSDDAIERYLHRYQHMLAARQHDPSQLAAAYADVDAVILSIDGLQPEKGHETLYVVRELERKRVWFAEALLSSATAEVQRLLAQARSWAAELGKPVRLWISDKQDAFVRGIAAEFPGVPHRYCANHFLRDVAKPVLEADSHAKVHMRRTVRGLRAIEREV